jgi:lipid-A-disaccharide synthase-like uncharacterized protein
MDCKCTEIFLFQSEVMRKSFIIALWVVSVYDCITKIVYGVRRHSRVFLIAVSGLFVIHISSA